MSVLLSYSSAELILKLMQLAQMHQGTCRGNRDPSGWLGKNHLRLQSVCCQPTHSALPEGNQVYLLCFAVNLIAVPIMVKKPRQGPLSSPGTRAITCPESAELNFPARPLKFPAYLLPCGLLGTITSSDVGPLTESFSWHLLGSFHLTMAKSWPSSVPSMGTANTCGVC